MPLLNKSSKFECNDYGRIIMRQKILERESSLSARTLSARIPFLLSKKETLWSRTPSFLASSRVLLSVGFLALVDLCAVLQGKRTTCTCIHISVDTEATSLRPMHLGIACSAGGQRRHFFMQLEVARGPPSVRVAS
eukprot:scaffold96468_cov30-Tisochrysis_lutea.AAC.1